MNAAPDLVDHVDTLAAQQRRFAAALRTEQPPADDVDPGPPGRLQVYRDAYRARLVEALRNNHPVLHRVLGDDEFRELSLGYLDAHPSRRPSIRWFGDRLAAHLAAHADTLPHPSLVDLARMEWALGLSFDAADAPVLPAAALAQVAPERWPGLRFEAHPSVALLAFEWAVEPLWRALTDDEQAQAEPPQHAPHTLLVWRRELDTRWRTLPDDEAPLLRAALNGEPFAALCERAAEQTSAEDPAARIVSMLRRWVDDGLFSHVLP